MAADAPPLSAKELDWLRDLHERAQRSVQGSHVRDEFLDSLQHRAGALLDMAERALAEARKPASEDVCVELVLKAMADYARQGFSGAPDEPTVQEWIWRAAEAYHGIAAPAARETVAPPTSDEVKALRDWQDAVVAEVLAHPDLPCDPGEVSIEYVPALLAHMAGRIEHADDYDGPPAGRDAAAEGGSAP